MTQIFGENTVNVIPDDVDVLFGSVDEQEAIELSSQVAVGAMGSEEDLKTKAQTAATFEGQKGARKVAADVEFDATRTSNIDAIASAVQTASADILATQMLTFKLQEHDQLALEKNAVDGIANTLPKEWRDIVDDNIYENAVKEQKFQLILRNFIKERMDVEEQEGFIEEIPDFIKFILPIEVGERLLEGGVGGITDTLRGMFKEARNMSPEDADEFLRTQVQQVLSDGQFLIDNPASEVELLSAAADGSDKALNDLRFWQSIGVILAPFELNAVRGLRAKGVADELGGNTAVADDIMKEQADRIIVKDDPTAMYSGSTMKAPFDTSEGVSEAIKKNLDKNDKVLNTVLGEFSAPEGLAHITARYTKEFEASYGANRVLSSNINMEKTNLIEFTVGTVKNTPFKTEASAKRAAEKMGIEGAIIARHPASGFVIKTQASLRGVDTQVQMNLSWWGKNFNSIDNIIAKGVVAGARQVEGAENQVFQAAQEVFNRSTKILGSKKGIPTLRVIQQGIDNDEWLSLSQFNQRFRSTNGRLPTAKEQEAYFGFKQLNDFDWELKNQILLKDSLARGENTYKFGDLEFNAAAKDFSRAFDAGTNSKTIHVIESSLNDSSTISKGTLTPEQILELSTTHKLLELNPRFTTSMFENGITGEPTKFFLVPKGSKARKISPYQMPYKQGGRRRNNSPAYLKVGVTRKAADGSVVRLPDIATHGAKSRKQAQETAVKLSEIYKTIKMLRAREGGLAALSAAERKTLDDLIQRSGLEGIGITGIRTADDWFDSYKLYDYDVTFAGVRDRELVQIDLPTPVGVNLVDETDEPIMSVIKNEMNGRRGSRLRDLDGEESTILDPLAALADSLDTTARFASTQGYRERMLQFMSDKFGRYLDHDPRSNPINLLTANPLKQYQGDSGLKRTIETYQRFLEESISKRTRWEDDYLEKAESTVNMFLDAFPKVEKTLDGWIKNPVTGIGQARATLLQKATVDPGARVKNLVFNAKLGMFNVPSFIIQAINMTNIVALSPKHGMTAAKHAVPARLALVGGVDNEMRQVIAKGWKEAGFKSQDDFFEYIDEFKNLGLSHLGRSVAQIGGVNGSQLGSSKASAIAEVGRVFFNEGELMSRLTAYGAARLKWLSDNPGKSAKSAEGREWIQNETHRLSLGMSRADIQLGFRGLAGVPTQFWSYPFRLTAAMMPEKFGGRAFTAQEKTRLFIAQALLYGSAGIPLVDMAVNGITADKKDLDPVAAKALTNGAIDTIIFALSDGQVNTNFAGRAGVGQFVTDIVRDMRDKPFLEFATGAAGTTTEGLLSTIGRVVNGYALYQNPDINTVSEAAWTILASEISSFKMYDRTKAALRFGYLFTKNGQRYAEINNIETVLMVGGIPPQAYENVTLSFISEKERRDMVNQYAASFIKFNQKIDDAMIAGDISKQNSFEGALQLIALDAQEAGIADDVYKRVIALETQGGMLEARLQRMAHFDARTPEKSDSVGTNQQVLNQLRNKE